MPRSVDFDEMLLRHSGERGIGIDHFARPGDGLAQAAADMAGEKAQDIDPALTLRKMAPEAGRVGGDMMRSLLRAVDANAGRREGGK